LLRLSSRNCTNPPSSRPTPENVFELLQLQQLQLLLAVQAPMLQAVQA